MTKKENFEMIMESVKGLKNENIIKEFCEKEIANLEKKNASNEKRKADKEKAHAMIEKDILNIFTDVDSLTPKEIADELGLSVQKITPRLKALTEKGVLVRNQEKKVIFYTVTD